MILIVLFGLLPGAAATWLLLEDTSLKRTLIAALCGIAAGFVEGVAYGVLFYGRLGLPLEAVLGTILGVGVAVTVSRRSYRSRRDPGDLRNP